MYLYFVTGFLPFVILEIEQSNMNNIHTALLTLIVVLACDEYNVLTMSTLCGLAENDVNFIRTYTNSPTCLPERAAFLSGTYTLNQGWYNNYLGFSVSSNGIVDETCASWCSDKCKYYIATKMQNNTLDFFANIGYNVYLCGKVDMDGSIINLPSQSNSTGTRFHSAPGLASYGRFRTANIKICEIKSITMHHLNMTDNNAHP